MSVAFASRQGSNMLVGPKNPFWPAALLLVACARSPATIAESEPAAPALRRTPSAPISAMRLEPIAPDEGAKSPLDALAAPAALPAAVVELFTSEGCSSCPPADQNLAAITALAEKDGQRVYGLELHVDYWNDLGWVDPFSSSAYSERQRAYAESFRLRGIYTPQMVVNGREEFVGSRGSLARDAITRALATPAKIRVAVNATHGKSAPTLIRVDYDVGPTGPVDLHLAVALDRAETRVTRGENANQLLKHRHVVLAFDTRRIAAAERGQWLAPWPASAGAAGAFVVAYVSEPGTLAIVGAEGTAVSAGD